MGPSESRYFKLILRRKTSKTHTKRKGTTAVPIAAFLVIANPAERPMRMANVKNMPTTVVRKRGRRPNRSTLIEAKVAMIKFQMAAERCQNICSPDRNPLGVMRAYQDPC
jgi:hypothetical protein